MRSLLPRRPGIPPAVELLEDRRLPSLFGPASGWDDPTRAMPAHFDPAPPIRGPIDPSSDGARPSNPGPAVASDPSPSGWASPVGKAPDDHAPAASPTSGPPGDADPTPVSSPAPTQTFPESTRASNPAAASSNGADSSGLVTASQAAEPAAVTSEAGRSVVARGPDPAPQAGQPAVAAPSDPSARAATPAPAPLAAPALRSGGSVVQPLRVEVESSSHADAPEQASANPSSILVAVTLPVDSGTAPDGPARGSATSSPANGAGSIAAQARLALDPGAPRGSGDGRSPGEAPSSTKWEPGLAEGREAIEGSQATPGEGAIEVPEPRLADLIMDLAPLARSSLEGIVDRFLGPLEGLPPSMMADLYGPMGLLTASLTLAATVLAVDGSLRVRRSRAEGEGERLVEFPGLGGLGGGVAR